MSNEKMVIKFKEKNEANISGSGNSSSTSLYVIGESEDQESNSFDLKHC